MFIDSHCHINDDHLLPRLEEVLHDAKTADVGAILVLGWDYESSLLAVEIAEKHEGVFAAVGFHPENIEGHDLSELKKIESLLTSKKVVAIGEIGLDYHWKNDPKTKEEQKKWFEAQIELANAHHLPASIHARDAMGDIEEILKRRPVEASAVLHCYSGSLETMKSLLKYGYYFGFDGPVTYKNAIEPKRCASFVPSDRLLSETDSPYLPPIPHRGETNEPKYVPLIVSELASLRGESVEKTASDIQKNFEKLFRVKL